MRILVGFQPHSGQDNYHGAKSLAYGGDFEAQRHWMELTWQLPISQWYWHDLEYWGLDYPPLTAYVSYLCGALSHYIVGPHSVALYTSRGLEDSVHKAFMRGTVLVTDLIVYGTAAWYYTRCQTQHGNTKSLWLFFIIMSQPAIILIDHGHFQYNTVALGLSLWAFQFVTKSYRNNTSIMDGIYGSILFCTALSFKQMTLYYAPAVFFFLLGQCWGNPPRNLFRFVSRILVLGITVISSFFLLWWPFILYGPEDKTYTERATQVIRRIFPLQRGLFEGKVSNLWCAFSVRPFRIRQRIPSQWQFLAAVGLTLLLILPCSAYLFQAGTHSRKTSLPQRNILLWGATSSALGFFLASFQVHEKSLLLALAPCSLLWDVDEKFVFWFSIVSAWTLWPLLQIDRLQTAYFCTMLAFGSIVKLFNQAEMDNQNAGFFNQNILVGWIPALSYGAMIALHVAELFVTVPSHFPDLFAVLWSIVGCGLCCIAWVGSCWHLRNAVHASTEQQVSRKQKLA
jgi:alpha-1,3-glucosyltransferase